MKNLRLKAARAGMDLSQDELAKLWERHWMSFSDRSDSRMK